MPFIDISSAQWTTFLETGLHDLYHLPEYVVLEAEWMKGEPLGWIYANDDCRCLMPLIRRNINITVPQIYPTSKEVNGSSPETNLPGGKLFDLISPYGYPGILPLKRLTAGEAFSALGTFQAEAAAAGYVSSFIRLHPFLNNWLLSESQCCHGSTLSIDLKSPKHFSMNHRRNLSHLHREGYSTLINRWNYLSNFAEAYTATMIRRKAAPRYLYTYDYFSRLSYIAGKQLFFITVLSPDGEFCSGGLFSYFGRTMQYLFGATVESALHNSPSKLMMEEAINLGVNHGAEVLHLGGGVGAGNTDGVYRFKQGFANRRHTFHCLHFIHRPEIYHSLSDAQREAFTENPSMLMAAEESSNYGDNPRFFPSYRTSDD